MFDDSQSMLRPQKFSELSSKRPGRRTARKHISNPIELSCSRNEDEARHKEAPHCITCLCPNGPQVGRDWQLESSSCFERCALLRRQNYEHEQDYQRRTVGESRAASNVSGKRTTGRRSLTGRDPRSTVNELLRDMSRVSSTPPPSPGVLRSDDECAATSKLFEGMMMPETAIRMQKNSTGNQVQRHRPSVGMCRSATKQTRLTEAMTTATSTGRSEKRTRSCEQLSALELQIQPQQQIIREQMQAVPTIENLGSDDDGNDNDFENDKLEYMCRDRQISMQDWKPDDRGKSSVLLDLDDLELKLQSGSVPPDDTDEFITDAEKFATKPSRNFSNEPIVGQSRDDSDILTELQLARQSIERIYEEARQLRRLQRRLDRPISLPSCTRSVSTMTTARDPSLG